MSEFIQNSEYRLTELLNFSLGIMNGGDTDQLIEKHKDAINNIIPHDMLALEDKQIRMGISAGLIKNDVEKVLGVFFKGLKKYSWTHPQKDTFLYSLMLENEMFSFKLNQVKKIVKNYEEKETKDFKALQKELLPHFNDFLEFEPHYIKKENILFPYLEKQWESYRPLNVMWSLHDDIRKKLKVIISTLENETAEWPETKKLFNEYFFLTFGMIQKENFIIFPVATETVSNEEWLEMHKQSFEYPFPFIEQPAIKVEQEQEKENQAKPFAEENLGFLTETGNLSYEQVLLIFDHLPVDITFVDEYDKVRFFSRAKDRFFPRSPAIIGRDVQNCHPPESMHVVEKIISEFKNGNKEFADFRIKMRGKYILIRYFAMRDLDGKYKGILEVGQEISEISTMTDEKRLLDWNS